MSRFGVRFSRACITLCIAGFFTVPCFGATNTNVSWISHDMEAYAALDVNRMLGVSFDTRVLYRALLWDHVRASAGISFTWMSPSLDGYFLSVRYENILDTGLGAGVSFIADIFPASLKAVHGIIPSLSWRMQFFFAEFGVALRSFTADSAAIWNIFHYASPVFETLFHYQIGCTFAFFNEFWTLTASFGNFDEFYIGNFGTIMLRMRNEFLVSAPWRVFADVTIRPSGSLALAGTYAVIFICIGGRVTL